MDLSRVADRQSRGQLLEALVVQMQVGELAQKMLDTFLPVFHLLR